VNLSGKAEAERAHYDDRLASKLVCLWGSFGNLMFGCTVRMRLMCYYWYERDGMMCVYWYNTNEDYGLWDEGFLHFGRVFGMGFFWMVFSGWCSLDWEVLDNLCWRNCAFFSFVYGFIIAEFVVDD
jgi:hypothetical protein